MKPENMKFIGVTEGGDFLAEDKEGRVWRYSGIEYVSQSTDYSDPNFILEKEIIYTSGSVFLSEEEDNQD